MYENKNQIICLKMSYIKQLQLFYFIFKKLRL